MPRYDFACKDCGEIFEKTLRLSEFVDVMIAHCRHCHESKQFDLIIRKAPQFEDWGRNGQGRHIEDFAPKGMTFYDKKSYQDYMKRNGIREWRPKQGNPGCEV